MANTTSIEFFVVFEIDFARFALSPISTYPTTFPFSFKTGVVRVVLVSFSLFGYSSVVEYIILLFASLWVTKEISELPSKTSLACCLNKFFLD
ncbi:TPA: hypothetical protein IAA92_03870 [Candidatus Galligastranaerophilus intestinigallinarum]|nr:hypothetical protein [Candidatus Galligastranaerophilus intestinigallinarum]